MESPVGASTAVRTWAREVIRHIGGTVEPHPGARRNGARRLLLIHLDGVPRALLEEGVREQRMPFLSSLVRSGTYHLDHAFWGSPASTPCFQAGLLYGLRHPNLPAYHWYDRELGRVVRMNVPKDARAVEERLVRPGANSLLQNGGTTYLSLFGARAQNELNMTSLAEPARMARRLVKDLQGLNPLQRRSTWAWFKELGADTVAAGRDGWRWGHALGDDYRHEREFLLNRFFMISLGWGLAQARALVDMVRGVPAIYLVFGSYDEVAHRRGPLSEQARRELWRVDAQLEELYAVAQELNPAYDLYFVTDHGHVDSVPLERRRGRRLEGILRATREVPLAPDIDRALLDGRTFTPLSPVQHREDPVVIEAGNFAHLYLTRRSAPLEAYELLQRHKAVLGRLSRHPDIGIIAMRRGTSAVAIIQGGVYGPGELHAAPLSSEFSRRALGDLIEELPHMPTAGDLVLFGEAVAGRAGATVGFAWEFGSHGGLTRIETDSVVCWPASAPVDLRGLSHVTRLHDQLASAYAH